MSHGVVPREKVFVLQVRFKILTVKLFPSIEDVGKVLEFPTLMLLFQNEENNDPPISGVS